MTTINSVDVESRWPETVARKNNASSSLHGLCILHNDMSEAEI